VAGDRFFTGTIQTWYANFYAGEEAQENVFQNVTLQCNHFADAMHGINVLSHVTLASLFEFL